MAATGLLVSTNISSTKYNFSNGLSNKRNKPRIILHSSYDYTDVYPLNLTQTNRQTNLTPTPSFSKVSPEKLIERSQQLRLNRLSTCSNLPQEHSVKIQQKTSLPIIARHQSLSKVKTSPIDVDQRTKSKIISANHFITRHASCKQTNTNTNSNHIHKQNENGDDKKKISWTMDEEFRQYLQKATMKCADWLIQNNFDQASESVLI